MKYSHAPPQTHGDSSPRFTIEETDLGRKNNLPAFPMQLGLNLSSIRWPKPFPVFISLTTNTLHGLFTHSEAQKDEFKVQPTLSSPSLLTWKSSRKPTKEWILLHVPSTILCSKGRGEGWEGLYLSPFILQLSHKKQDLVPHPGPADVPRSQ